MLLSTMRASFHSHAGQAHHRQQLSFRKPALKVSAIGCGAIRKSRGLAHSTTLRAIRGAQANALRLGLRRPSAALSAGQFRALMGFSANPFHIHQILPTAGGQFVSHEQKFNPFGVLIIRQTFSIRWPVLSGCARAIKSPRGAGQNSGEHSRIPKKTSFCI